ncbi:MAG: D-mannonate epimerase, partial [Planctomycetota bacterium]
VPHEVIGMANHNKNVFVGCGGSDIINKTHFLGAVYNMERIMGRLRSPVRDVLDYAEEKHFSARRVVYALTVMARGAGGHLAMNGLYIGDGREGYEAAARLSQQVNITQLDAPLAKVVVYLDPAEFKSTWLGNKSIYRTRMAMADKGELIVLAPGLAHFGEDKVIDGLIRKYGYVGTPRILEATEKNEDLRTNRSAAAHLIHGSSEGRFAITYAPGKLTRAEIEGVGFRWADLKATTAAYDPSKLKDGWNEVRGERVFFISNPALGLWGLKKQFENG